MEPVGADVDLGPWAAYSIGRHPYALLTWHLGAWTKFQNSFNSFESDYQHEDPPELEELDYALNVLSSMGRVNPVALNAIHRHREEFVAINKEIGEIAEGTRFESDVIDTDSLLEPGYLTLLCLIEACEGLIAGLDNLQTWLRLGAAVGEYPLILTRGITMRWESLGECCNDLRGSIKRLAMLDDYSFLSQLDHHLASLDPTAKPPPSDVCIPPLGAHRQALVDLDGEIRHSLKTQAPPVVWFDLDETRLMFFGVTFSIDRELEGAEYHSPKRRLSLSDTAILWVLAEKAGEFVHRRTIRAEGRIAPAHDRQQEYISRMRKKLKPAVKAYFTARSWELTKEARMCFILSDEGGGKSAPYVLAMDKSRVRVPPDRPSWMKPRTGKESSR